MRRLLHARPSILTLALLALSGPASGCFTPMARPNAAALTSEGPPPDFALPDQDGRQHRLSELLAKGPVVLVFYRGYW
ncbi:MAG: hypothetical protein ABI333_19730 [bacterium]